MYATFIGGWLSILGFQIVFIHLCSDVTPNVVAMGFPSEGMEGMFRNPMIEVQKFFETRHPQSYRYNLCSDCRVYLLVPLID